MSGHLLDHGLPQLVDSVRFVLSELATNAVLHSQSSFTVTLAQRGGEVRLAVRDGSARSLPALAEPDLFVDRGRGLHLVDAISSSWGVTAEAGGKAVWATFDLVGPKTLA